MKNRFFGIFFAFSFFFLAVLPLAGCNDRDMAIIGGAAVGAMIGSKLSDHTGDSRQYRHHRPRHYEDREDYYRELRRRERERARRDRYYRY